MLEKITSVFTEKFAGQPTVFRSPGRINILGEHTDYNEGFVLPAAIDKSIYVAITKRADNQVTLFAGDFNESYTTDTEHIKPAAIQWPNYILGVVDQLQKEGHTIGGFNLVIDGDIPIGAGLSSSAAVECAVIFALNTIFELGVSRLQMVKLAQKAEHVFAGVHCGIMDQFASMFGKKDHAIKLDCRSLEYEYVPISFSGYSIVLFNTNVKHSLDSTEYNTRRKQCEEGVSIIAQNHPGVKSLRDVSMAMLKDNVAGVDSMIFKRCKYVVQENQRLLGACDDLKKGDVKALGKKMFETHRGLQYDYEVSCRELDFLVDFVKNNEDVAGARMVGGGFGGCTINLVRADAVEKLVEQISTAYLKEMNLPLSVYPVSVENGTCKM
ncbi:MAG: galactokinase [Chitinophagaceae bacterium]|nr:galactokinase [Chitinophagaceae bacterium]MBK9484699.1 galactokinase [Chitinophagaceae bacterium]